MAKNNALIEAMKIYRYKIEQEVTNIYGGMALALHEIGIPADQIVGLFEMTDSYWNDCIAEGWNMTDRVSEEVGIDIQREIKKK